jgi:hypothetical protein
MSWPGTTDQQRSLFLKGFKLSDQGKFEDPTYLGFKIVVDFGTLPVDAEFGQPPSPLFRTGNYEMDGGLSNITDPFGQQKYLLKGAPIQFYSAQGYLNAREGVDDTPNGWTLQNSGKRSLILAQFKQSFRDLLENHPWFLQSIEGLDKLYTISRGGYTTESEVTFNPSRTAGKTLTFSCLESFNQRMSSMGEMYKQATFDPDYMRELVPRNLRRFKMFIFVNEIRNFFKTSRLLASSTTLTAVNNVANLLGGASNSGRDSVSSVAEQFNAAPAQPDPGSSSSFGAFAGSFARNVADNSGLQDEIDYFRGQANQSDIKPVLIFECSNCEFDFDDSTSIPSDLSNGSDSATPISYSFKIHVGRVRTKYQFPNIRTDKKPLVLADGWDQNRTSVATDIVPDELTGSTFLQNLANQGEQLLTNFVSNSINDFINEGIAQFVDPLLNGLDQSILGNIYSFNPSELLGQASFNNAQQFFDQVTSNGINAQNLLSGELPNPQTMGLGGPKERSQQGKYRSPSDAGPRDAYANVPGPNLGVTSQESGIDGRIYQPPPNDDFYPNVPGEDLGVPNRLYDGLPKNEDSYPGVPGGDLGVPDRVYPEPTGDFYENVPGGDLGVPGRTYPEPSGDLYANTPGEDLGVPDRLYPAPEGDFYEGVPGPDLGGPERIYNAPEGDVYSGVPGADLGGPERIYNAPEGDVYSGVPGADLGGPERIYNAPEGDVYEQVPGADLGGPERIYNAPEGDVYAQVPGSDLGGPERIYNAPEGDVYSDVPGADLGGPERIYNAPEGDVYEQVPGEDLGGPERIYNAPEGDVYAQVPGSDLGGSQRIYNKPEGDVYEEVPGSDLGGSQRIYNAPEGDVYSKVPGSDLGGSQRIYNKPEGDVYDQVPGSDLGGSGRLYDKPGGDVYEQVPGQDLGGSERVYNKPDGDVYDQVPGSDLGGSGRVYNKPEGDVYKGVPGQDLGVSDRIYQKPEGDVYTGVPGPDLGGPDRNYSEPGGDLYEEVPGQDLGGRDRVYPTPGGDVYPNSPGSELGVPRRIYKEAEGDVYPTNPPNESNVSTSNLGDVYVDVPGKDLASPQRVYPEFKDDVYQAVPGSDLGGKSRAYLSPEGDAYMDVPGKDLGVSERAYPPPGGDVYEDVPGKDLGGIQREYPSPDGDTYPGVPGQDLGGKNRNYLKPEGDVYTERPVTPISSSNIDTVYEIPTPQEIGNSAEASFGANATVYPSSAGDLIENLDPSTPSVYPETLNPNGEGQNIFEGIYGEESETPQQEPGQAIYQPRDVYSEVPGSDLGIPNRDYPKPSGNVYAGSEGQEQGQETNNEVYLKSTEALYPESKEPKRTLPDYIDTGKLFDAYDVAQFVGRSESSGSSKESLYSNPKVYKEEIPTGQLGNSETLYPVNNNLPGQAVPNPLDGVPSVYRNEGPRTIRGDMDKVYPKTAEDFVMERNLEPEQGLGNLKPEDRYNHSLGDFNPPDEDFIE